MSETDLEYIVFRYNKIDEKSFKNNFISKMEKKLYKPKRILNRKKRAFYKKNVNFINYQY